jgi:hypothetical protein
MINQLPRIIQRVYFYFYFYFFLYSSGGGGGGGDQRHLRLGQAI